MERAVTESDVSLLICTKTYTEKANERRAGVGYESILYTNEYLIRTPEERARMIPVVRDNDPPGGQKLPRYLGSATYVDMSGLDWHARPMLDLVDAIKRHV